MYYITLLVGNCNVDYYNGAGPIIVLDIIMDAIVDDTSTMNTEETITSNHHSFTMY